MQKKFNTLFLLLMLALPLVAQKSNEERQLDSCNYFLYTGKHLKVLKILESLEPRLKAVNDNINLMKLYKFWGRTMADLGDLGKSGEYHAKGLAIATQLKDEMWMADFNAFLGSINTQFLPQLSLEQFAIAKKIYTKIHEEEKLAILAIRYGAYFGFAGQTDSVSKYYDKAIEYASKTGKDSMLTFVYLNKGADCQGNNDPKGDYFYTKKAMGIATRYKDFKNLSILFGNLTSYYITKKQYDSAEFCAAKAIEIGTRINYIRPIIMGYDARTEIYTARNNYKEAFLNLKKFVALNDSFRDVRKNIVSLKNQMDMRLKDTETKLLEEKLTQKDEFELSSAKKNTYLIVAVLLALLVFLVAVIFYLRFKTLGRKNQIIEKQSQEKTILVQEIHHRVKNNLQIVSSLLNLQSNATDDVKIVEALKESHNRIKTIGLVHDKLYNHHDLASLEIRSYIEDLFAKLKAIYKAENVTFTCEVLPADLLINIESAISIGLILNELLTNSFKYAFAGNNKGTIAINLCLESDGKCRMKYADSGPGLSHEINLETSKTLGLRIIKELSRKLKGTVSYSKQNGSVFEFRFPLDQIKV